MATVLNRTTKQLIVSANTPDYPVAEWIINPDMSAVEGYPSIYWIITGDVVSLMSQAERDVVDNNTLNVERDATANRIDAFEDIMRAMGQVLIDEINLHSTRTNDILSAIDACTSLTDLKNKIGTLNDLPIRTIAQVKNSIRAHLGS